MHSESNLSQRDNSRTQLFGSENDMNSSFSPFDKSKLDYSQSTLAQLESQSEENMNVMNEKIKALKSLSLRMGDEIRGSNKSLDTLGDTFENATVKLKHTYTNMMIMAKKSGISFTTWILIFVVVFLLFFWVWIT
ncbi:hypothetical protein TPHA_0L00720 [Tetrapisispora phaffii CBS 4417]|uniref:t-SNARE coiled-coil homology domain-containing protein n=1 Tax=Tetrapisispora phaffii (strain ATCC 24235 / CBS 4417 / NBRC 1672 / NRRL Y-8282 / UCD 70-5) TaxID=1071381 RepID=G8BZV0_TETPH|nr:hypothetical protein TPHA_0L00720 [Tetrapisispora phaffii CBS 4417]CCE65428.1 hypothetical protein TPHA_0L00720 [Tetrapisispora phaffii CBS 4417]